MNTVRKNRSTLSRALVSCLVFFLYLMFVSFAEAAAQYTPIVAIPGLNNQSTTSLPDYLNRVYFFTITIGALYGVVKIAFAGVKYSMSDIITSKESAKEDIKGVLLGLAILLIPFIVLRTINPELTRLDVLSTIQKIKLTVSSTVSPGGGSTEGKMKSCTVNPTSNNKWDHVCGVCTTKEQPDGASCKKTQTVNVVTSCSSYSFTEEQKKDLAGSCQNFCAKIPNAVFSRSDMTCSYGSTPPS